MRDFYIFRERQLATTGYRIQNTVYLARVLIEEEKSMYNIFTIYIVLFVMQFSSAP